jgi:hypothetical protein
MGGVLVGAGSEDGRAREHGEIGVIGEQDVTLEGRQLERDDALQGGRGLLLAGGRLLELVAAAAENVQSDGRSLVVVSPAEDLKLQAWPADAVAPAMPHWYPGPPGFERDLFVSRFVDLQQAGLVADVQRAPAGTVPLKFCVIPGHGPQTLDLLMPNAYVASLVSTDTDDLTLLERCGPLARLDAYAQGHCR